jgi:hypothetical protein
MMKDRTDIWPHRIPGEGLTRLERNFSSLKNEIIEVYNDLVRQHGKSTILKYIQNTTNGIEPTVAERWLEKGGPINIGLAKKIVSALKSAQPKDFPAVPARLKIPLKPKE